TTVFRLWVDTVEKVTECNLDVHEPPRRLCVRGGSATESRPLLKGLADELLDGLVDVLDVLSCALHCIPAIEERAVGVAHPDLARGVLPDQCLERDVDAGKRRLLDDVWAAGAS